MIPRVTAQLLAEYRARFVGELDSLTAIYRQAAARQLAVLANAASSVAARRQARALLAEHHEILNDLNDQTAAWLEEHLPNAYRLGQQHTDSMLEGVGINLGQSSPRVFATVHRQAVAAIATEMRRQVEFATAQIGRRVDDFFRKAGVQETAQGIAAGLTRKQISRNIQARLQREGITKFTDRIGRDWDLARYTEMVARTTQREAMTQGTLSRSREHGVELVTIPRQPASDFCAYYQGGIYYIGEGEHSVYPSLDSIGGPPPFHPNCEDVIAPFIVEFATPAELERGKVKPEYLLQEGETRRQYQRRLNRQFHSEQPQHKATPRPAVKITKPKPDLSKAFKASTNDEALTWQEKHYGAIAQRLSKVELAAVEDYQHIGYQEINKQLRQGKVGKARTKIAKLDSALAKMRLPENVMLYRGVRDPDAALLTRLTQVGEVYSDRGFTSTSLRYDFAKKWASKGTAKERLVLEVYAPKGTPAVSNLNSPHSEEYEVLLPREARFRIIGSRVEQPRLKIDTPLRIVEIEIIDG